MAHAVSNRFASSNGHGRKLDTIVALGLAALAIAAVIAGRLIASGSVPSVRDAAAPLPPIGAVRPAATEPNRAAAVNIERAEVLAVTETAAKKYRVAVIAIESGFNPVAQSSVGATGLMQVIPAYHAEKFPAGNGDAALDPRINIRVGTRVLKEYVSRAGTETAGLQRYAGSTSDPRRAYATKVLAERARLREAAQQARARLGAPA